MAKRSSWSVRVLSVGLAAALGLGLSGCGGSGARAPAGGDGQPRSGGSLRLGLGVDPVCLDPSQSGIADAINIERSIVDSLTAQDPKTNAMVPWLASSWEVSPDASAFTFHLRPGVTFSDGSALSATTVRENFDAVVKAGGRAPLAGSYLAGYLGTDVVDPLTARVRFSRPNAQFLQATSTVNLGLLSSATLARPLADRCVSGIIGSGPFVLDSYVPRQSVTVHRRDGYRWAPAIAGHTGDAYLETITYSIVPDEGVRSGALRSGQVSGVTALPVQAAVQARQAGLTVATKIIPGVVACLSLNPFVSRPAIDDSAVRQAVVKAVNRAEVVSTVLSDDYKVATSILAASTPGYVDLGSSLEFDPAGAGKLLDVAGWRAGSDGIRQRNGQRLTLEVAWTTNGGPDQEVLELIQQQVREVGIELKLRQFVTGQAFPAMQRGVGDYAWGAGAFRTDPDILRAKIVLPGPVIPPKPGSPAARLNADLALQASTVDEAERRRVVGEAQHLAVDDGITVPVYEIPAVVGLAKNVRGFSFTASANLFLYDTWLENG
ncbi:ABC transporter substrate-binding protein [Parafrankia sp. EUN1f]|uniref:ABC transporter substrate-binding protein n=1 Tax=Parafrankia sp. EUN1f TaxID=102897 RepID=UPI0001C43A0C|nr:ABC transporter substrate-binding protein [Parafrankia sp. EUN1f]EFC85237.1 extracellular solute-binding protein family 5 [Parafrankia sp. EUN1f]